MGSVVSEARQQRARRAQDQTAESEVCGVEAAIETVLRDPSINDVGLFERLRRKVGLGDHPAKRRALFQRLVDLHKLEPEVIEILIAEAWASSLGARRRDRYFCVAACRKLVELGRTIAGSGVRCDDVI